jgi:transmembrane 9 superfamily protein 2/4
VGTGIQVKYLFI